MKTGLKGLILRPAFEIAPQHHQVPLFFFADLQQHFFGHGVSAFVSHAQVEVESLGFDHHGQFEVA